MPRSFRFFACFALAVALSTARPAAATVTVVPAMPGPADTVRVRADGEFIMGATWSITSSDCAPITPDSLILTVTVQYCNGAPGCLGQANPVRFTRTCAFPPLPVGPYVAVSRERHVNPLDPRPVVEESVRFTVSAPTPVLRRTWGRLKTAYR